MNGVEGGGVRALDFQGEDEVRFLLEWHELFHEPIFGRNVWFIDDDSKVNVYNGVAHCSKYFPQR